MQAKAQIADSVRAFLSLGLRNSVAARCQGCHCDFHQGNFTLGCGLKGAQVAGLNAVLSQFHTGAYGHQIKVVITLGRILFQQVVVQQIVDQILGCAGYFCQFTQGVALLALGVTAQNLIQYLVGNGYGDGRDGAARLQLVKYRILS